MTMKNDLKSIIKSKHGIAIESAVIMLLTVFLLCALITAFCVYARNFDMRRIKSLEVEAELDTIGERFTADPAGFEYSGEKYVAYSASDGDIYTLTVTDVSGTHKLTVKYDISSKKVMLWTHVQKSEQGAQK